MMDRLSRRALLGASAMAASTMLTGRLFAQQNRAFHPSSGAAPGLPQRANLVIRGAYVVSMDPAIGELPSGDVHVRDGRIVSPIVVGDDGAAIPIMQFERRVGEQIR